MKVVLREKRAAYAKQYQMSIEEVPEYEVKTPLQRVVQILKRHRDIYFLKKPGERPVSIIITTLAAKAYRNQEDLYDALTDVVRDMPKFIEQRNNGQWWVPNPVDPDENFADKWNEYPDRRIAFLGWLKQVGDNFDEAAERTTFTKTAATLSPVLGESTVARAAASLGFQTTSSIIKSAASVPVVPDLGSTTHCIAPEWPVLPQYQVSIMGTVHPGSKRSKASWPMTSRPVPRNVWLRFEAKTNAPEPYEIRWQVVNTGRDAILANALRGDEFELSNGATKNIRWETTEYRGTHWIEAFVVRNGTCVARSKPFQVRIRG